MSQQINLYDPTLLKKRELLTATNLAATALVLLLAMGGWGLSVRAQLAKLEGESSLVAPLAKDLQDQVAAIGKQLAEIKVDPRLEAQLASVRELLGLRSDIAAVLKKGIGSESVSFAEYLRGLARQTPNGLWLTGFTIAASGESMEIRGRMVDPALLPDYIRRLNSEKAFKGRAFAALKVSAGKADPPPAEAGGAAAAEPAKPAAVAAAGPAPFHEFTLVPSGAPVVAAPAPEPSPKDPQKLADLLPPEVGKTLGGKR